MRRVFKRSLVALASFAVGVWSFMTSLMVGTLGSPVDQLARVQSAALLIMSVVCFVVLVWQTVTILTRHGNEDRL
jgi:hypothetical protein